MKTCAATVATWVLTLVGVASAFEIAADRQIDGEAPTLVGEGTGNTVTPSGTSPDWTYAWKDRDGDGSSNAVADAGLLFGSHMIYCGRPNSADWGTVILDLDGGDLTGSGALSIRMRRHNPEGSSRSERLGSTDDLILRQVGSLTIGGIDAGGWHEYVSRDYRAGSVAVGTAAARAGSVRIGYLYTHATGDRAAPGHATLYTAGHVAIADATGTPGDIRTHTAGWCGGDVRIDHVGTLTVGRILTHTDGNRAVGIRAGNVTLDGNDSSGDAEIGEIVAWNKKSNYTSGLKALFSISNYQNVRLGNVDGSFIGGNVARYGADLSIETGITGDIELSGSLDLRSVYANNALPAYRGSARLVCGGVVKLASLDLSLVRYILLDSDAGFSEITGTVTSFDTAHNGGVGTESDPYATTQTALRAPEGQWIFYAYRDGLNAGLGGYVYRVASPDGTPAVGGLLAPEPVPGVMFRVY